MLHPTEIVGRQIRVRTPHEEHTGYLRAVEDWGLAGGGNYLILAEGESPSEDASLAVAMREIEALEVVAGPGE